MAAPILYMGDNALDRAAGYLGGVLAAAGLPFDYAPSGEPMSDDVLEPDRDLYIISDYPVKNFQGDQMERMVEAVRDRGTGLLMIGGWESFHGVDGNYQQTPIAGALCVDIAMSDDRVNWPYFCAMEQLAEHPIIDGLPFHTPAGIGGYNRVKARPTAEVVLGARRFEVRFQPGGYEFLPIEPVDPLLVTGSHGQGRSVAFTTDVAPHWVGPLVDWGPERIESQANDEVEGVEVGNWYAQFLTQLVRWTARA